MSRGNRPINLNPKAFMSGLALLAQGFITQSYFNRWRANYKPRRGEGKRYNPYLRTMRHHPHQGAAEIARRQRQLASGVLRTN